MLDKYRIVRGVGGNYWVNPINNPKEEIQVNAPGILRNKNIKPKVGDIVKCNLTTDSLIPLTIDTILERKNQLDRPPIANIDLLWLIIPLKFPEPDLNVLDKMLIIAEHKNIPVNIIFSKYDLNKESGQELDKIYSSIGYETFLSDKADEKLLKLLRKNISKKLVCLAGPSGAGKSTLLNNILGDYIMDIGEVSKKLKRGKHTTRHVELFNFSDGYISDTPGFSSLDLSQIDINGAELAETYPEFRKKTGSCQFSSCRHINEPNCAIKSSPSINSGRLTRYINFRQIVDNNASYNKLNL